MNFSLDKEKAIELAAKLGMKVSFNNAESGVIIKGTDTQESLKFNFESFFPELETLKEEFIMKDEDVFFSEITVKHQTQKIEIVNTPSSIDISNSKKLTGAA